ncbi:hypothetical protein BH09PSE6_BH09PSE6_34220 [soil metagenome]
MPTSHSSPPSSLGQLVAQSEQLLEAARLLAHENLQLKSRLASSESRAASLEKRLGAARARVEALIAKLPDNEVKPEPAPWLPDAT